MYVETVFYSREEGNISYESDLARRLGMPKLKNGYWIFLDRCGNIDRYTMREGVIDRSSENFSVGIIDLYTNISN